MQQTTVLHWFEHAIRHKKSIKKSNKICIKMNTKNILNLLQLKVNLSRQVPFKYHTEKAWVTSNFSKFKIEIHMENGLKNEIE